MEHFTEQWDAVISWLLFLHLKAQWFESNFYKYKVITEKYAGIVKKKKKKKKIKIAYWGQVRLKYNIHLMSDAEGNS